MYTLYLYLVCVLSLFRIQLLCLDLRYVYLATILYGFSIQSLRLDLSPASLSILKTKLHFTLILVGS